MFKRGIKGKISPPILAIFMGQNNRMRAEIYLIYMMKKLNKSNLSVAIKKILLKLNQHSQFFYPASILLTFLTILLVVSKKIPISTNIQFTQANSIYVLARARNYAQLCITCIASIYNTKWCLWQIFHFLIHVASCHNRLNYHRKLKRQLNREQ